MKANFEDFKNSLTEERKVELLEHFNNIYECNQIGEHELKVAYLAFLWENGFVYTDEHGLTYFLKEETGFDMEEYEITFENDTPGGVNLDLMYDYYEFCKINKDIYLKFGASWFNYTLFENTMLEFNAEAFGGHPTFSVMWTERDSNILNYGPEDGRYGLLEELKEGKTLFFPFSTSNVDGEVYCANGKTIELNDDDDENEPNIGQIDCVGFILSLNKEEIKIETAINCGGDCMFPSRYELSDCGMFEDDMKLFLQDFIKS